MCVSEICCHRRGASRDFERSRFTSRDHSGVPVVQHHWQPAESAAFRSWPFKIPSASVSFFSSALFYRPPAGLQTATVASDRVSAAARFCGGRFAETSYRASTGWAARGQGAILSDDGRRSRLCFGIQRMLTVRRDGVMV